MWRDGHSTAGSLQSQADAGGGLASFCCQCSVRQTSISHWLGKSKMLPLLHGCLQPLSLISAMLHLLLSTTVTFMQTLLFILLTACLPSSSGFLLYLTLTGHLQVQGLSSVLSHLSFFFFSGKLWTSRSASGSLSQCWTPSSGRFQDTCPAILDDTFFLIFLEELAPQWVFLSRFLLPVASFPLKMQNENRTFIFPMGTRVQFDTSLQHLRSQCCNECVGSQGQLWLLFHESLQTCYKCMLSFFP